ncbi:MAG: glucosaminidase domain-containing protein [Treponema sp.]|nr:glucosaminidase domain-containing protein [Treponema sp.]
MRYYSAPVTGILCLFLLVFLSSCKSLPVEQPDIHELSEIPPAIPEKEFVERPRPPEEIMGKGMAAEEKLALFLMYNNTKIDSSFARSLAGYYIEEAAAEGVNHDVAFAQMCLETGSLHYGGLVTPDMNNFCGLGSTGAPGPNGPERGNIFPDPRTGVRAHIQHLKAYASKEPLNQNLVDPRYGYVRLGISPTIHGLAGRWAADTLYSKKLAAILKEIYEFSF